MMEALTSIAEVVSAIGIIFTGVLTMVGSVAATVVANPLMAFSALVGFTGMGITIFQRLINVR